MSSNSNRPISARGIGAIRNAERRQRADNDNVRQRRQQQPAPGSTAPIVVAFAHKVHGALAGEHEHQNDQALQLHKM